MSVTYTADVWCDGEDCNQWAHGVTGARPPTKQYAREVARRDGFRRWMKHDYCPACFDKMMREALAENERGSNEPNTER